MADSFYVVQLAADEEIARYDPRRVDKWLVQLVCEEHQMANFRETDREASACEIVVAAVIDTRYVDGNSCRFDSAFRVITDYQKLCGDATTAESLSNR